jgi:putative NIF3 family GTP cyclohydrolase 1 type 2
MLEEPRAERAGMGIIGEFRETRRTEDLIKRLKDALGLESVRLRGKPEEAIRRVAVCGGAGGDMADLAASVGAQLFITGEIKHNQYVESSIALMELGHYGSEKCFCAMMADGLQKAMLGVKCNVTVCVAKETGKPYSDY